ncbi:MAG: hypothetical protein FJ189_04690, partial [Gammaproteobacteria bacterium]|nr:hypothetical protein [Gammaproteobacteria bacterium]
MWIVPLQRTPQGLRFNAASSGWVTPATSGTRSTGGIAAGFPASIPIPNVHNITADQSTGLIFLCTNTDLLGGNFGQTFMVLSTNAPGTCAAPVILFAYHHGFSTTPNAHPHDAYVKDGRVYVSLHHGLPCPDMSSATIGCVEEYLISDFLAAGYYTDVGPAKKKTYFAGIAQSSWNPAVGLDNPFGLNSCHSVYKHSSTLWLMSEEVTYQKGWLTGGAASSVNVDAGRGRCNVQASYLNLDAQTGTSVAPTKNAYQPQMASGRPLAQNGYAPRFEWENQQAGLAGMITLLGQGLEPVPAGWPFPATFQYQTYPMNAGLPMHSVIHQMRGVNQTAILAHYVDGLDIADLSDPALGPQILGSCDTTWSHIQSEWYAEDPSNPGNPLVTAGVFNAGTGYRGVYDVWAQQDSGLVCAACGEEGAIVFRVDEGWVNRYWKPTPFVAPAPTAGYYPRIVTESGPPRFGRQVIFRDGNRSQLVPGSYQYTLVVNFSPPTSAPTVLSNGILENVSPLGGAVFGPQPADDVFVFPASMVPAAGTKVYFQMIIEEGMPPSPGSQDQSFYPYP